MAAKDKLDIFSVLGSLNKRSHGFYEKLSTDEQKALQPLVVMRWMSGSNNQTQIYMLNEVVNPYVFTAAKHKHLLVNLMSVCGTGKNQRLKWIKGPSMKTTSHPKCVRAISEYFGYSFKNATDAFKTLAPDVIIDIVDQLGWSVEDIKLIKQELKGLI